VVGGFLVLWISCFVLEVEGVSVWLCRGWASQCVYMGLEVAGCGGVFRL